MCRTPVKDICTDDEVRTRRLSQHIQGVNLTHLEMLTFKIHSCRDSPYGWWGSRGVGVWPSHLAVYVLHTVCFRDGTGVVEKSGPYPMCQLLCKCRHVMVKLADPTHIYTLSGAAWDTGEGVPVDVSI